MMDLHDNERSLSYSIQHAERPSRAHSQVHLLILQAKSVRSQKEVESEDLRIGAFPGHEVVIHLVTQADPETSERQAESLDQMVNAYAGSRVMFTWE